MKKRSVVLRMDLTNHQLRGLTALTRCLSPMDIERIASESGDAECILSALDELQWALSAGSDVSDNKTGNVRSSDVGREGKLEGRQTLKGLEAILRGGIGHVDRQ